MSQILLKEQTSASTPTPAADKQAFFVDSADGHYKKKLDDGSVVDFESAANFTNENAQDAVGSILTDTATVALDYNDTLNQITADVIPAAINHDALLNYSANRHVNHSAVSINAGSGLTGGGDITVSRTLSVDPSGVDHNSLQNFSANKHIDHSTVNIVAGLGLTGGGDLTSSRTLNVNPVAIDHDALNNFVANEHIDHSTVSILAGSGLTGGGDITASRTLNVNPAAVNHNSLLNYVSNEHVDHSTVQIATSSLSGLTGGGTIAATRNLSVNITGLPQEDYVDPSADEVLVYDVSASALRKVKTMRVLRQEIDRSRFVDNDFITDNLGSLTVTASGTGAAGTSGVFGIDLTENARGVSRLGTGTTATGRVSQTISNVSSIILSPGDFYKFRVRLAPELLSSGTETYTAYAGFIDNTGAGDQVDGAYFRYTDAVNGGRWEAVVSTSSTRQAVDTGVAAGLNYAILEVQMDYTTATPTARFYIEGSLVATQASPAPVPNLPANSFGFGWKIEKTVGVTSRFLSADYYSFEYFRSAAR